MAMRRIAAGLLLLLLLVCLPGSVLAASRGGLTFLVFPPDNESKLPDLGWIGEGLAIAVSEEMETPNVETLSWDERVRFIESIDLPTNTPLSRGSMIRVAQKAAADALIFGSYSGTAENLRIALRVFDLKSMKLSGEHVANGPVSALPQLENELAWVILSDAARDMNLSREVFRAQMRKVPNQAYTSFINCLSIADGGERAKRLLKTLDLWHDFPQASFLLGEYYYNSGDWLHAIQYLKPALNGAQNLCDAEFMLGTSYLKQADPSAAIQAYTRLTARYRSVEPLNNLGVAYARKGEYAAAARVLTEARAFAKADMVVEVNLALVYHLQGEVAAALSILGEAVKAHPDEGMLQYLLGLALDKQGDSESSARAFDQARKLGLDPEKLNRQDPRLWTRFFSAWTCRSPAAWTGEAKIDKGGNPPENH